MNTSNIALIFPGQGSQKSGMGKDFFDGCPESREIFERADSVLGRSISRICFEGTEEELRQTSNTQPALFVTSAAMLAAFRSVGAEGGFVAGHSLGEYTALYAAGTLRFDDALRLVQIRADAMEAAGRERPGAMAAILNLDPAKIEEVCREASSVGIVVPANLNNAQQIVISGEEAGIDRACELAKAAGAKRALKLNVGGAFHSPLMSSASEKLAAALATVTISPPSLRFVANVSADFLADPEAIRTSLAEQILNCVRWSESIERLISAGVSHFVEVGPGNVLSGLIKRIAPDSSSFNLNSLSSLNGIVSELKQ